MQMNATIEDMHGLLQVDFANMFIVSILFEKVYMTEYHRVVG
jgi:hypothetical protein